MHLCRVNTTTATTTTTTAATTTTATTIINDVVNHSNIIIKNDIHVSIFYIRYNIYIYI